MTTFQERMNLASNASESYRISRVALQAEADIDELVNALQSLVDQIDPRDTPIGLGSYLNAIEVLKKHVGY